MLELAGGTTVYLACGATDLRKSYHGLAAIIGSMSILWAQKVELFSQHNICRENYFLGC